MLKFNPVLTDFSCNIHLNTKDSYKDQYYYSA